MAKLYKLPILTLTLIYSNTCTERLARGSNKKIGGLHMFKDA